MHLLRKVPIALTALLMLAPIIAVVLAPLHTPAPEWDFVRSALLPGHLIETARLVLVSALLAIVLGSSTAWLVTSARFPGRDLFRWALMLPLALPTYIGSITFAALLGPTGSLSRMLRSSTGIGIDILTPDGLAITFGLLLYPYVYLPARAVFSNGMSDLLEAARTLGASPARRARRVAFPMARPAIAGGALLVAMEALNDYGAVQYYGVHTLTAGLFKAWGGLYDTGSALRIAGILLLIVLVLAWGEERSRGRASRTSTSPPLRPARLHGWRALTASIWCTLVLGIAFVLPFGTLVIDTVQVAGTTVWSELTGPLLNTLKLAGGSALLTLLIALLFAFAQRNGQARLVKLTSIGYAVPGAVIAMGVMGLAGTFADRTQWILIGTVPLVMYAFAVRFLAMATNPLNAGLATQPRTLDDSARLLGASRIRTFLHINLPLLRPSLVAASAIVLIEVMKELPLTLILRPFGMDTLSTHVFYMARIEQWREAAPPALLIVLCSLLPVLLLERWLQPGRK
ncbi:MAG TPA: iron ABC transporter permease [Flavobacteriales bacterium]